MSTVDVSPSPEIRYAKNGEIHIAYMIYGEGPNDLVWVPGFASHIELVQEHPFAAKGRQRLGKFARVIAFDKRGTGLSDRGHAVAPLEDYANDVGIVMDDAGVERAAVLGISEGGSIAALFAAMFPERVSALIIYGGWPRIVQAPDFPIGIPSDMLAQFIDYLAGNWGTPVGLDRFAPSIKDDPEMQEWWARYRRLSASPSDVRAMLQMYSTLDVRDILPTIRVPTLVLHRKGDEVAPVEAGRYLADHIPGARYVELEGTDHMMWTQTPDQIVGEIEEFLTGARQAPELTRKLSTVLFTDIVGSTETAAGMGDKAWRELLQRHDAMIRRALESSSGREIKSTGDGFLAIFDGPSAAIRSAEAIRGGASGLGLTVRAGVHTGEIELMGDDIGGLAVHIARRVGDLAGSDEIWVSGTVPGVAVGSGIEFEERGTHSLKGVPGDWSLFSVR